MKRKKALKAIAKLVARTSKETEWFFGLNQSWIKSSLNETNVSEVSRVSRMLCKKGNFARMNWQF